MDTIQGVLQSFATELRHRWKLVLLIAILASGAMITERVFLTDPIPKSSSLYVEQQVFLDYEGEPPQGTSYQNFFTSYGNLIAFLRQTEDTINYEKFQPGWYGMLDENKAKWAKKHFTVDTVSPSVISLTFKVSELEWKDPDYAKAHALDVMKAFVAFNEAALQNLGVPITFKVNEPVVVFPEAVPVSRGMLCVKYGILGFLLGTLAGCMGIFVIAARFRHRLRHTEYSSLKRIQV